MITKKYNEIIRAAKAGGEVAKKYFGKVLKIEGKSIPADFRTRADLESEKAIFKVLKKAFPKYNIISEEAGEIQNGSEYTFIIDPLDGTNNFVLGIPYFSTAIGLVKGDEIIFGVVYNSILDNLYFAEKEKGAYLNGKKIKINKTSDIKQTTVSVVVTYYEEVARDMMFGKKLYEKDVKRVLFNWSVLLDFCLMASGKTEALIIKDLPLHDFIPGKIIAKEAGAYITDFDGNQEKSEKNSRFLISNGTKIHQELLEILKQHGL